MISHEEGASVDGGCIGVARFVHFAIPVAFVQPTANAVLARAPHGTRKSRAPLAEARISVQSSLGVVDTGRPGRYPWIASTGQLADSRSPARPHARSADVREVHRP